jgi:predicted metal-dependent peptidase
MTARERIQQEAERWFLTDPLFFTVYCTHRLKMNANMQCAFRSGQGRIEYNPDIIDDLRDAILSAMLRVEMIRILLQHPYARQPLGCKPEMLHKASDMVISPAYHLGQIDLTRPEEYGLPIGQHYEWYAKRLCEMGVHRDGDKPSEGNSCTNGQKGEDIAAPSVEQKLQSPDLQPDSQGQEQGEGQGKGQEKDQKTISSSGEGDGGETAKASYTALWEEDPFQSRQITDIVQSTMQWGSIPGNMIELIKKAAEGKIDYRNVLRMFRSSILSQRRRLTRMRPSRRFGFEQMGSRYEFITRLLIAIDTSGSVGSEELARYFRVITTFFKYGVQEIDVLMFDHALQGKPLKLDEAKKNKTQFEVKGRGGTCFQVPIDYVKEHPGYDGLIIITDGYAPTPDVPPHLKAKLLWVIDNEESYKLHYESLRKTGRVCLMQL